MSPGAQGQFEQQGETPSLGGTKRTQGTDKCQREHLPTSHFAQDEG